MLGILPGAATPAVATAAFVELDKSFDLVASGRLSETPPLLQRCSAFILMSQNADVKAGFAMLHLIAMAARDLAAGNAHGALANMSSVKAVAETAAFFDTSLKKPLLVLENFIAVSVMRILVSRGDIGALRRAIPIVRSRQEEAIRLLDDTSEADVQSLVHLYSTRVELGVVLAVADLCAYELAGARKDLSSVEGDVSRLNELYPRHYANSTRRLVEAELEQYEALASIVDLAETLVCKRRPYNRAERTRAGEVLDRLCRARELAEGAGDTGSGTANLVVSLHSMVVNMEHLGVGGARDFGRYGGVVAGIAYVPLITLAWVLYRPEGWWLGFTLLVTLVLALVVGFGAGAIRFRPFVKTLAERLFGVEQP